MLRICAISLLAVFLCARSAPAIDFTTGALIYQGVKKILPGGSPEPPPPPPEKGKAGNSLFEGQIGSSSFAAAFTPGGEAETLIISEIAHAKKSILCAAPLMGSRKMADALIRARHRGLKVMLVADAKANEAASSVLGALALGDIPVRVNAKYGRMSHRFIVIDENSLILPGLSFTNNSSQKEAAGVLVINDCRELARTYAKEWLKLWHEGVQIKPARDKGISVGPKPGPLPSTP